MGGPIGLGIRPMAENDYHDIYRLYRQIGAGFGYREKEFSRIFRGFFGSGEREAFVATVHERVIGFVTLYYLDVFHHNGQVASIQELVVAEEFRGRGVGSFLVDFIKRKIAERNCRGLEVATDLWQGGAKPFYERCGFQGKTLKAAT